MNSEKETIIKIKEFIDELKENHTFDYKINKEYFTICIFIKDINILFICFLNDKEKIYKKKLHIYNANLNEVEGIFNRILNYRIIKFSNLTPIFLHIFGHDLEEAIRNKELEGIMDVGGRIIDFGSYHIFRYKSDMINKYKKEMSHRKESHKKYLKTQQDLKYYLGSIWYPLIYFQDIKSSMGIKKIIEHDINDIKLIIDNFGIIFIGKYEPPLNRVIDNALEILNVFLSLANLNKINATSISEDELVTVSDSYYEGIATIGYSPTKIRTVRAKFITDISFDPYKKYDIFDRSDIQYISVKDLLNFINKIEDIIYDERLKSYLLFYLESKTKFIYKDYKSSFLTGWMILEKYIEELWIKSMENKKYSRKRKRKLTNNLMWSMDYIIEAMNMSKDINNDEYNKFMKYKKIRNDIIHEGKKCDITQNKELINLVESILLKMIN